MKCCFTGHRCVPEKDKLNIMIKLERAVKSLVAEGCTVFCAGGALGFDTLAALAVMRAKSNNKNIKLHLYLPWPGQAEKWRESDRLLYEKIKSESDAVFYSSQEYVPSCMNSRNRALVDNSDVCVAYCTQPRGGTAFTVSYAMDMGKPVLNIAQADNNEAENFGTLCKGL